STARFLEDRDWSAGAYARLISKIIVLATLGAAVSSVFLFENVSQLFESPRVGGNVSYASRLRSQRVLAPATPEELSSMALRLFSNDLQGTGSDFRGWGNYLESPILYVGLITLLTAPQFLVSLKRRPRRIYLGLISICVVGLIFPYFRLVFW